MKISGFTYVRNGFDFGYPFKAAIQSLLPIVDEMIVIVGDSTDGTREAVESINSDKIKIIDTVWDMEMRRNGKIFAQQANLGLDNISGNWVIHIQADEVLHEDDQSLLKKEILDNDKLENVEGLLFPFYHFWGDFCYIRKTRKTHNYEIRAFKNKGVIRSYRDSQGFRKYNSLDGYAEGEKGEKLKVVKINVPIYHYSYVRHPRLMAKKSSFFDRFWHADENLKEQKKEFDYNAVDKLDIFKGTHPKWIREFIRNKDWDFNYDPSRSNMSLKYRILYLLEKITGIRPFSYKNYKLISTRFPIQDSNNSKGDHD